MGETLRGWTLAWGHCKQCSAQQDLEMTCWPFRRCLCKNDEAQVCGAKVWPAHTCQVRLALFFSKFCCDLGNHHWAASRLSFDVLPKSLQSRDMLGCVALLQWRAENSGPFSLVTCSPAPDEVGTDSWSLLRVGRLFPLTLVGICVEAAGTSLGLWPWSFSSVE